MWLENLSGIKYRSQLLVKNESDGDDKYLESVQVGNPKLFLELMMTLQIKHSLYYNGHIWALKLFYPDNY